VGEDFSIRVRVEEGLNLTLVCVMYEMKQRRFGGVLCASYSKDPSKP
jgi:hypothetical protein